MAAGRYSFTIEQGATTNFDIAYKDSNGDPIDLTGYGGRMQFRDSPGGSTVYLTLSSSLTNCSTGLNFSGSENLLPPTSGTIGLRISAQSSSAVSSTQASYDLEIVSGSGDCYEVIRLIEGRVQLSKQVTTGGY